MKVPRLFFPFVLSSFYINKVKHIQIANVDEQSSFSFLKGILFLL